MDILISVAIALGIVAGVGVVAILALGAIYSMSLRDLETFGDVDWDEDN